MEICGNLQQKIDMNQLTLTRNVHIKIPQLVSDTELGRGMISDEPPILKISE